MKRTFDLLLAVPAAVLTAPLIAVLCLLIRLGSPGDPIFTQVRAGRDGEPFRIFKLRTMVAGAQSFGAGDAVLPDDARITRIGRWLRRTSLDEIPNLWNVVRGEMSIVGPRPTLPGQVTQYTPRQWTRLNVRPGMTGWAQVNGRAALSWPERIELDIYYVEHHSLWLDLQILARTVVTLLGGHGLYHEGEGGGWVTPS
ncbi:sugar transferase [Conexibacter sp. DBS9H8]|uniref:sugar transferase n=1 Tax=Conexibacter sp. DBS9H8 TaxID=2937801 RepID=UPI00200C2697|nr:sugar transferase [Conexibacter sp. DBS9H8]